MRKLGVVFFTFCLVIASRMELLASPAENAGLEARPNVPKFVSQVSIPNAATGFRLRTLPGGGKLIASGFSQEPMAAGLDTERLALMLLGISLFGFAAFMRRRTTVTDVIRSENSADAPQTAGLATISRS